MRLEDTTKDLSTMTDDELREHIKHIRYTKYVTKPAKTAHIEHAEKVITKAKVSKVNKKLIGLSDAERQQLILLLEQGDSDE